MTLEYRCSNCGIRLETTNADPVVAADRRQIDWRLGWIDRRRRELEAQLADLDRQESEVVPHTTG